MTLHISFERLIWRLSFFVVGNAVVIEEEGRRSDGCFCMRLRLMEDLSGWLAGDGRDGRPCGQLAEMPFGYFSMRNSPFRLVLTIL